MFKKKLDLKQYQIHEYEKEKYSLDLKQYQIHEYEKEKYCN